MNDDELDQAAADAEEDHFQMIAEAEAGGCLGVLCVVIFLLFIPAILNNVSRMI